MPSGTTHDPGKQHLFVIATDPDTDQQVLLISISSWTNDLCDSTCVLEAGCHEFIRRKSWAFYRRPRIENVATLIRGVQENVFAPKACLAEPSFGKLCDGVLSSPQTPRKFKAYYLARLNTA